MELHELNNARAVGSLNIVGCGINAIAHMTPEAKAAISGSDIVFMCVSDPSAEIIIRNLNNNVIDLFKFYSERHPRFITYELMTNEVVSAVRRGADVSMIFYGHPTVCATSTNAAAAQARSIGAKVRVLPAISTHDAIFASLGIDVGLIGCQIYEATSFVTRRRNYDLNTPLVIYQIGAVGDINYYKNKRPNICLGVLLRELISMYGGEHFCVLSSLATNPFHEDTHEIVKLSDISDIEVRLIHTLVIPPLAEPSRREDIIDEIHMIRDEYYELHQAPQLKNFTGNKDTMKVHPSALWFHFGATGKISQLDD